MDLNKISEQTIMYIVTAIAVMIIAVGVRYASVLAGVDVGTANLLFVIVLAVELVLYLLLHKSIGKVTAFFRHISKTLCSILGTRSRYTTEKTKEIRNS